MQKATRSASTTHPRPLSPPRQPDPICQAGPRNRNRAAPRTARTCPGLRKTVTGLSRSSRSDSHRCKVGRCPARTFRCSPGASTVTAAGEGAETHHHASGHRSDWAVPGNRGAVRPLAQPVPPAGTGGSGDQGGEPDFGIADYVRFGGHPLCARSSLSERESD